MSCDSGINGIPGHDPHQPQEVREKSGRAAIEAGLLRQGRRAAARLLSRDGPWSKDQFHNQLAIFPEGQIGVEYHGKLVASSSSLVLDFELYKDWHNFDEISDNGFILNWQDRRTDLYEVRYLQNP